MSVFDHVDVLASDPTKVEEILVDALKRGYLSLFLGAGVSISAGQHGSPLLPSWIALVESCCKSTGVAFDPVRAHDNTYLRKIVEDVKATFSIPNDFLNLVEKTLYASCSEYNRAAMKLDLLVALGSLVMSSVRGSVAAVINYNFDDLLEWYLEVHGFKVNIVSEISCLTPRSDVIVYHPHGFLPLTQKFKSLRSTTIVFDERSYQQAAGENAWNEIQRSRCGSNISLFIGMSGEDPHVDAIFAKVHERLNPSRILGVMILVDSQENREKHDHNKRRGIINYYIPDYSYLPDFLLNLCKCAADV